MAGALEGAAAPAFTLILTVLPSLGGAVEGAAAEARRADLVSAGDGDDGANLNTLRPAPRC